MKPWERRFAEKLGIEVPPSRPVLAPLEPDAFLRWAWEQGTRDAGTSPLTVDDLAFELAEPTYVIRRQYVRLAAIVRRNQRLGVDPWEGVR